MSADFFPGCVPELTDGLVRLRAHRPGDAEAIVAVCRDPDTQRWTTVPRPYGPVQASEFLAAVQAAWNDPDGVRFWAVTDAADPEDRLLGTIDLRPRAGGSAETGFNLHPQGRGRGLMAGALRLVCQWWFDAAGGSRVHWQAERGNFASWRVAWACGFTHHGTVPGLLPVPGSEQAGDAWLASLAAHEDREPRTPWLDPPTIRDDTAGGLLLRAWQDEDVEALEPRDQPTHHMPARGVLDADTFPEWLLTRREKMATGTTVSWCIADAQEDHALGEVLLFVTEGTLEDDTAELGYQVLPSARRRGVATEAVRLAVRHAFTPRSAGGLGLRRLVAQTAEDNVASNRVLDGAGFSIWGHETDADVLPGGRTVDALHWELLRG